MGIINKIFGKRYEIEKKIGSGGMAIVYKARDILLNRTVAVKVLREQFVTDEAFLRRFLREAQSAASLSHPNIVSIYDVGKDGETEYIVMECVEGQTLKEIICTEAPMAPDKAIFIIKQIAEALSHAHVNKIIHRDIKPQNILMTPEGRVKVTDFGIARAVSAATLTHTGDIVGSVHYLSPEQAKGAAQITEQSDIYSLGIIFYELITGKVPYDGDTPITIALKHIQEQPEFPDKVVKGVSEELNAVILKTIAKSLDDRYKNAAELLLDLQKLESGETIVGKEKYKQSNGLKGDETLVHKGLREKILEKNTNDPIKSNKKRLTTPVLIILIIGLILGIAGGAYAVNSYFYAANVEVPDLSGLTIEQAKLKLEQKELVLGSDSKYVYDDEVELNNIISQSIKSGSMVKTGRTIDVTVSRGVEMVKFPDVTSMSPTQENAVNMIREAGFDVDKIQYVPKLSSVVEEGKVVGQSPAAYATWPTNGKITLSISGGEKLTTETMPDVIGMSSSEATNILNEYKLNVVVERQGSDLFPIDAVMVTSPSQGKPVKQGTEVKMIVSVGPGPLP